MSSYIWPPQSSGGSSGVSSLNTLTGDLTIIAGTGISVTPGASSLTIAATGGAAVWGSITGTLSSQTDLQNALNLKANLASPTFSGTVTAPTFSGALSGNATTATTATTATNATNVATTATNATNATFFPTFVASSSSGNQGVDTATGLTFNPSTNTLATTTFSGALSGNATTATSAATWTTARNLAGNSVNGSANVAFSNKFIVQGTTDAGLSGPQFLGALATGIVKNTTSTGVLSIAIAADFPTLNQNTSGTAAGLSSTLVVGSGGTGVTSVTTAPTATAFAGWDANANLSADSFIKGYTTTATAAGTTTLTVSSTELQYFTGVTTQNCKLPAANTLVLGQQFWVANNSSGIVTVQDNTPSTVQAMAASTHAVFTVTNIGSAAGTWDVWYSGTGGGGFSNPMTTTGDIIYSSSVSTPARLGIGTTGQVLSVVAGLPAWVSYGLSGSVRLDTSGGNGSINTCIPYWTNISESIGSAITYTHSTSNGDSFTVTQSGVYSISYASSGQAPSITKNLNTAIYGSTNVNAIPQANILVGSNSSTPVCSATTVILAANDVIRGHNNGTAGTGGAYGEQFCITLVAGLNTGGPTSSQVGARVLYGD